MKRFTIYIFFIAAYAFASIFVWLVNVQQIAAGLVVLAGALLIGIMHTVATDALNRLALHSLCGGAIAYSVGLIHFGLHGAVLYSSLGLLYGAIFSPIYTAKARDSLLDRVAAVGIGVLAVRFAAGAHWPVWFIVTLTVIGAVMLELWSWLTRKGTKSSYAFRNSDTVGNSDSSIGVQTGRKRGQNDL